MSEKQEPDEAMRAIEEVALIVGAPEGTVKTRMFHARRKLSELAQAAGMDRGWP